MKVLKSQVMDQASAAHFYEKCVDFAAKYHETEPGVIAVRDLLATMDTDLRAALKITKADKYKNIKNKMWKADITRFLSVAFYCVTAHTTEE